MICFQEENIFYACGTPVTVMQNEKGETHVYSTQTGEQLSTSDLKFGRVFGGGKGTEVESTSVVMKSGFLYLLAGGSFEGNVKNTSNVSLEGGMIGGYLYGSGIRDKVGNVNVKVSGGAVKYGLFGCGSSTQCENVDITFENIVCTNVRTGSSDANAVISGETHVIMLDGHVLDFTVGGGKHEKDAFVEVHGGNIEKQFVKAVQGQLNLKIYENIFRPNGVGGQFPMIPEGVNVTYLPAIERENYEDFVSDDTQFFNKTDEDGKLIFRFFELRHPDVPRSVTPFPAPFVGDCYLVTFPDGKNMLVDLGSPYNYEEVYGGLVRLGVEKIDILVITHPHGDHMGCMELLMEEMPIGELWIPDINAQPAIEAEKIRLVEYYQLIEKLREKGTKILSVADGDVFYFGETQILVVNPVRTEAPAVDMNENSVALKITYKENSALLCADVSDKSEKRLAEQYGDKLKCDLLKVAHHGIVYQSYYKFIDSCNPELAVVHSMRDNGVFLKTTRYTLKHVNGFDPEKMYVTGRYGKIKVVVDGTSGSHKIYTQYK